MAGPFRLGRRRSLTVAGSERRTLCTRWHPSSRRTRHRSRGWGCDGGL